jgi:hypothetical protein
LTAPSRAPKSRARPQWIMAKALKDAGYTYEEVMKLMGWRSKERGDLRNSMLKKHLKKWSVDGFCPCVAAEIDVETPERALPP